MRDTNTPPTQTEARQTLANMARKAGELRIALPPMLPADLQARADDLSEQDAEWRADLSESLASPQRAVDDMVASLDDTEPGSLNDLYATSEATRLTLFDLLARRCRLLSESARLLADALPAAEQSLADARSELAKAEKKAAEGLTKAGAGLESQRAWGIDPKAAERQFAVAVGTTSPVKQARDAVEQANHDATRAKSMLREVDQRQAAAVELVRQSAERAASV